MKTSRFAGYHFNSNSLMNEMYVCDVVGWSVAAESDG